MKIIHAWQPMPCQSRCSAPPKIICPLQTLKNIEPRHGRTRILESPMLPPMHHCSSKPISPTRPPANRAEASQRSGAPTRTKKSKGNEIAPATELSHPRTQLVDAKGLLACLFSADSRPTVRWLREQQRAGTIPFYKIGRLVRFNVSEVQSTLITGNQIPN